MLPARCRPCSRDPGEQADSGVERLDQRVGQPVLERGEDLVSDRGDAVGLGGRRPGFGSDGPRTASAGHRARADQAAIETVVQRLLSQFPEVPLETIQRAVAGSTTSTTTARYETSCRSWLSAPSEPNCATAPNSARPTSIRGSTRGAVYRCGQRDASCASRGRVQLVLGDAAARASAHARASTASSTSASATSMAHAAKSSESAALSSARTASRSAALTSC